MNNKRKQRIYLVITMMIIMGMGFGNLILDVSASNIMPESPHIYIDSRMKLWDTNEKMLDKDFNITIIYINETTNNSFNYYIKINNNEYSGIANLTYFKNFTIINTDLLTHFEIKINNITYIKETGIIITSGITQDSIRNAGTPFTLNLKPSEWSKMEWNIFFALIFSGVIGMIITYRLIKRIRKKSGVRTIR